MAIKFSSPQFSFFSFNTLPDVCDGYEPPCLPVYDMSELQFQVIATVDGGNKASFGAAYSFPCCISSPTRLGNLYNWENTFIPIWQKITTGTGTNPDIWIGFYTFFDYSNESFFTGLNERDCFTLSIIDPIDDSIGTLMATSTTCFYKTSDLCYTSLLSYTNDSDAFGFDFTSWENFTNAPQPEQVRLPFYLHSPTNAEEQKSYGKSDGSTKKLMHRIWKDYKFIMDYLDEATIEKFTIATACDTVTITNGYSNITGADFVRTEKVDVDWKEDTMPSFNLALSKGTLRMADPRANVNSNCS